MKQTSLATLALLALACSVAAAAPPRGISLSKDGTVVRILNGTGIYAAPPHHAKDAKVIFSNIAVKYPLGLYFCCSGATVAGPASALGSQNWTAMQFTPAANATVSEIDVAIQLIEGTNLVDFGLYTDKGGVPGKLLKQFKAKGFAGTGSCCGLAVGKDSKGIAVSAGTPYWVAITSDTKGADVFANWPFNTSDQLDSVPSAVNKGAGWAPDGGAIPAATFAVYGQ